MKQQHEPHELALWLPSERVGYQYRMKEEEEKEKKKKKKIGRGGGGKVVATRTKSWARKFKEVVTKSIHYVENFQLLHLVKGKNST